MQTVAYELGGYREYAAPDDLRDIIDSTWIFVSPAAPVAHRVLPDLTVTIALRCRRAADGSLNEAAVTFTGPTDETRVFRPLIGQQIEAVRLKSEWCRDLLGIDAAEHHNQLVPLSLISHRLNSDLEERLLRTTTSREAIGALLAAIRNAAGARPMSRDTRLAHAALERVRSDSQSSVRIHAIARALDISDRHLRRVVIETTGAAPKHFQRVQRLSRIMTTADSAARPDWSRLAAELGFFDQSHLVQELRAMTGQTPGELHRERRAQVDVR